jgi:hypothetical protein
MECRIDATTTISLFPNGIIPSLIRDDGLFLSTILNPLDLRILTVRHKSLTAKAMKLIRGGKIEKDYAFDPKTVLSNPGDGTIGLIIFRGGKIEKDYAFDPKTVLSNPGDGTIGLIIL